MRRLAYLTSVFVVTIFALVALHGGTSANLKAFQSGKSEELELAKAISFNYMAQRIGDYGISNLTDLSVKNVFVDELSMAHTRMQQTHQGVPVFGGEAIIHLNSDGSFFAMTDGLLKNVSVDTNPALSANEAIERVLNNRS